MLWQKLPSSGGAVVKNPTIDAGDARDSGSIPESGRSPWSRKWQPIPVSLPRKFHGQRSLAGYSPWGCKKPDAIEHKGKPVSPGTSRCVN